MYTRILMLAGLPRLLGQVRLTLNHNSTMQTKSIGLVNQINHANLPTKFVERCPSHQLRFRTLSSPYEMLGFTHGGTSRASINVKDEWRCGQIEMSGWIACHVSTFRPTVGGSRMGEEQCRVGLERRCLVEGSEGTNCSFFVEPRRF